METTIVYWGFIGIMDSKMEATIVYRVISGLYWDNGKSNGHSDTTIVYWGFIGIMENKMEATIVYRVILGLYWAYVGIMEKKMETTIMENQMKKKMENEMETVIIMFLQP